MTAEELREFRRRLVDWPPQALRGYDVDVNMGAIDRTWHRMEAMKDRRERCRKLLAEKRRRRREFELQEATDEIYRTVRIVIDTADMAAALAA